MTETTTVTMETLAAQQALVLGVLGWLVATGLALVLAAHWRRGVYYSTRGWLALAALPALGLWAVLAQQVATQGPLTRWDAALTQALQQLQASPDSTLIISADAHSTHQAVITVMEVARSLGLTRVTFATQKAAQ